MIAALLHEILCGRHKWVSRLEAPGGLRCYSEPVVEQVVIMLHGPASETCCGSLAAEARGLDACKNGKVVHWGRTQASCHNAQGFVDRRIDEVGVRTATPYWGAVFTGRIDEAHLLTEGL